MALLERDPQLQELANHLRQAADGHGRLVLISGESGVGKSALIDEFCQQCDSIARVMKATCDSLSTPGPFGPLLDIGPALGLDLQRMLRPDLRREELFHSVLSTLRTRDETVIIVGEDAHWSDEASIDLLRFLSRRIDSIRLLFLVTYRDDEVGPFHPLRRLLGDLATASSVFRLTVPPLSEAGVRTLAAGTDRDPGELFHRTGGNPFFVTEVLATRGSEVPPTVSDAVLARAARLSLEARSVLDVSAVIGSSIEAGLLMSVAGPVVEAMDECISGGLLRHTADGLAFRHELARDAILATIAAPRRRLLHHRVLDALLAEPSSANDFPRLAHHAEAAGDVAAIRKFATAAALQASALHSHREEAAQYSRLLRVAGDLPDFDRAALLADYSFACYLSSQGDESIMARREAVDIWHRAGDLLREGDNLRWLSRLLWFQGRNEEAQRAGGQALEILERMPPGPELAMAYSNMSQMEMLRWNVPDAIAWGEKAIALADRLGEQETLIHALINVGTARATRDDLEGRNMLERAHRLAADDGMIDHACRALVNLSWQQMLMFHLDEAERQFEAAITYAEEHDLDNYVWYLTAGRASLRSRRGAWDLALQDADRALAAPSPSPLTRIVALTVRGTILARRDDTHYEIALDEALALAEKTGELQRLGPVRLARADAAWLNGDVKRSISEARALQPLAVRYGTPWIRGETAYYLHRAGEPVDSLDDLAAPYALMIAGEWLQAARAWEEIGCDYERACALAQSGDEASMREAMITFSSLRAAPAEAWAARQLREIGVRAPQRGPRAATRENPAGLTHREMDVLELLSAGLTNAGIAERLFISPKTAGHHVSAILAKLGVESRTAAARRAQQLGTGSPQK